jgi:hypothetical protein
MRQREDGYTGERIILKSPTGQEPFDAIEVLDTVALDYAKTAEGFRATATIPLAVLGWKPKSGQTVKLDVGYLFGRHRGQPLIIDSAEKVGSTRLTCAGPESVSASPCEALLCL